MATSPSQTELNRQRVSRETMVGTPLRIGGPRVAMVYPSPYRVAMSSLGYQWLLIQLRNAGLQAERVLLPDDVANERRMRQVPRSLETETPLSHFPILAVSLAYEMELGGLVELLQLAGIPVLAKDRGPHDPVILLGGPLTFSNPLPASPFVDAMLLGEADETCMPAIRSLFDTDSRQSWLDAVEKLPGAFIPERHGTVLPAVAKATDSLLPARSGILSPDTELANMFMLEGERGCHRQCSFCVMRRSTNGGMRLVSPERVLSFIPDEAKKVGLVGAAISDHPKLVDVLETLVETGRGIGVSSLRADRVARRPQIAALLRKSGARTLTVASDAASQRLRRTISKGTTEKQLIECAKIAGSVGFETLKVYMMVGLPDEQQEDYDELIDFTRRLSTHIKVALGVAPFVAKRHTPLDGTPFAGIKPVDKALKYIKNGLRGSRAELRSASARWAWAEYQLAQGGPEAGLAVLDAVNAGGRFADYKRAFNEINVETMRPWAFEKAAK